MTQNQIEQSVLEQHIGTVLQILVVSLLGWSLMTTQGLSQDVAVLKVQLDAMSTTMQQGSNDRYRGTDAARDFASIRQELTFLEKRVAEVETRVRKQP